MITNFLSNAIRHTENGQAIVIAVRGNGQTSEISVENQGKPIAEEDRQKIWKQFYRAEARTRCMGSYKKKLNLSHQTAGHRGPAEEKGVRICLRLNERSFHAS